MAASNVRIYWEENSGSPKVYGLAKTDWGRPVPDFNLPGQRLKDREGVVHRLMPTDADRLRRYINQFKVKFLSQDRLIETYLSHLITNFPTNSTVTISDLGCGNSYVDDFTPGTKFTIEGSTNNNQIWTVDSAACATNVVTITTVETTINTAVTDGRILVVHSNLPSDVQEYSIALDTEFTIFKDEDQIDGAGNAYTEKTAMMCHLEKIPEGLFQGLASIAGESLDVLLNFHVNLEGIYTDITDPTSGIYNTRPF